MTTDGFEADLERARELVDREDLDGFYAGVVADDELDYVFAHRFDDPERVGMQALSLLAYHVQAIAEEADLPPEQVADDAARMAVRLDRGDDPAPGHEGGPGEQ